MEDLKAKIADICTADGCYYCGFCELTEPAYSYKYAVSIVFKLSDGIIRSISDKPSYQYYSHYRTVNSILDLTALKVVAYLERAGYSSMPVQASQSIPDTDYGSLFSHKTAARLSGFGFIGKNGLLVNRDIGCGFRMATVLTDFAAGVNTPVPEMCGDCRRCADACPAGAITGNKFDISIGRSSVVDASKCSDYMTKHFGGIGRGSVCGLCIAACPFTKVGK